MEMGERKKVQMAEKGQSSDDVDVLPGAASFHAHAHAPSYSSLRSLTDAPWIGFAFDRVARLDDEILVSRVLSLR